MLRQMQVPDSAKVNYQYSTKTVRSLSPEEMARLGAQPRTTTQPLSGPPPTTAFQPSQNITRTTSITQQQVAGGQKAASSQQGGLNPNSLMKNNQVDLADSEHIDITKSTFHAFYGTGQNQNQGLTSNQLQANYATNANKNSSAFSFSGQPAVNRSSGGTFEPIPEGQPNRISGGSVYDYDQLRKDY